MQEIENPQFAPPERSSAIKPWLMSHGTMQSYDLKASRRFYEEFLGLQCVRHAPTAMAVRCGMKWHIVCLEVGAKGEYSNVHTHWGLDVGTREEVDAVTEEARSAGARIGREPAETFWGGYSSVFVDPDGHPWEVAHNPRWTITEDGGVRLA